MCTVCSKAPYNESIFCSLKYKNLCYNMLIQKCKCMTDKMHTKQVKFWQISGELLNEKCTNIRIIDKLFSFVTPTIMSDFRMLTLEWCSSLYCIYCV